MKKLSMNASKRLALLPICAALLLTTAVHGQSRNTEHTLKLDDPSGQPSASLDDVDWMIGSWKGEAFGGFFEEHWLPPTGGTMTGVFKLTHEGRPSMYEFMMIVEEKESLVVRLKHFNADFSSWEEKAEYVSFPLVKLMDDAAYFSGLTYKRLDADRLAVHVAVGEDAEGAEDAEEHELLFFRSTGSR